MPNHMHGIIVITDGRGTARSLNVLDDGSSRRAPTQEQFQKPVKGSIPTIIRSYKSAVSYQINLMRRTDGVPVWQRNYYEHIIRNTPSQPPPNPTGVRRIWGRCPKGGGG